MNNNGQIAGQTNFVSPIRWDTNSGVVKYLSDQSCAGNTGGWAYAINDSGQVAGVCRDRAFRWTDRDGFVALAVPSADNPVSSATAINAAGWIAGTAIDKHGNSEAVLWDPDNQLVELGRPTHSSSVQDVFAINSSNLVAGNYLVAGSLTPHPFLAGPAIGFVDLGANGFQLPPVTRYNVITMGFPPPLPKPLNDSLQIIGTAGGDAVLLQPSWKK
jgi:hypothetical protein